MWIILKYKKTAQVPIYLLICKEVHCMVASNKYTNDKKQQEQQQQQQQKEKVIIHSFLGAN